MAQAIFVVTLPGDAPSAFVNPNSAVMFLASHEGRIMYRGRDLTPEQAACLISAGETVSLMRAEHRWTPTEQGVDKLRRVGTVRLANLYLPEVAQQVET